jgi:hypothetical protein
MIEGLLRENQSNLLFALLSAVSRDFDFSKLGDASSKNFEDFSFEKVEDVILSHVLQNLVNQQNVIEEVGTEEVEPDEIQSPKKE